MEKQEVTQESPIETALAKENVTAQVIAKLKADYSGLKINGLDDKEGLKAENEAKEKELAAAKAKADAELAKQKEAMDKLAADAKKKADDLKAANDKAAAEAEAREKELQKQIHEKQLADYKAKQDAEAKIQSELTLSDKPKFEKMLQAIEDIKTKYEFKAAKYKTVQASVNDLLDKTITYAKSKI